MNTRQLNYFLFLPLLFLLAAGCGGKGSRAQLKGQVTLDGVPVTKGAVRLVTEDGSMTESAPIGSDGQYLIAKAPVAPAKLAIVPPVAPFQPPMPKLPKDAPVPKDVKFGPELPPGFPQESEEDKKEIERVRNIHPFYTDPDKSELRTTVEKGENVYNIQLKSKPENPNWPKMPPGGRPPMPPPGGPLK